MPEQSGKEGVIEGERACFGDAVLCFTDWVLLSDELLSDYQLVLEDLGLLQMLLSPLLVHLELRDNLGMLACQSAANLGGVCLDEIDRVLDSNCLYVVHLDLMSLALCLKLFGMCFLKGCEFLVDSDLHHLACHIVARAMDAEAPCIFSLFLHFLRDFTETFR